MEKSVLVPIAVFDEILPPPRPILILLTRISPLYESVHAVPSQRRTLPVAVPLAREPLPPPPPTADHAAIQSPSIQKPEEELMNPF